MPGTGRADRRFEHPAAYLLGSAASRYIRLLLKQISAVGCFAVVLFTSILVMSSLLHFSKERAFREHGIKTAGELQDAAVSAALV